MFMRRKLFLMVPIGIAAVAVFGFLGGQAVRLLWNWLLPPLFGWPAITFWQALGLLALCRILFGGRGGHGWGRRTARMTPEERDRFRQRVRQRIGLEEEHTSNFEL